MTDDARPAQIDAHASEHDAWEMAHAAATPALNAFVDGYSDYWEKTRSFSERRELPSLRPVLIINLGAPISVTGGDGVRLAVGMGEGFVAGIHQHHAFSESAGEQAGVHIWLTMRGFQRLLGNAAGAVANRTVALGDLLGSIGTELGLQLAEASSREQRFQLLDHALAAQLANGDDMRPELTHAFRQMQAGCAVDDVARDIGWSRKTLGQQFRGRFGVSLKTAGRLARFERVVAACEAAGRPNWAGIAHDTGYADQSHLIREFSGFAGLTPTEYRARLLPDGGGLVES